MLPPRLTGILRLQGRRVDTIDVPVVAAMADDDGILPVGGVLSMTEQPQKTLDEQFHDVSIAIAESRDFTEFCFTRLDTKVDRLETKVDALDTRVGNLETKVDALGTRVDTLETKVDTLGTKVDALDTKVDALDTRVTSMATTMDRRFTRNELLLSEVLNEVRVLSRAR